MPRLEARFDAKVDRSGEHQLWTGAHDADGIGQIRSTASSRPPVVSRESSTTGRFRRTGASLDARTRPAVCGLNTSPCPSVQADPYHAAARGAEARSGRSAPVLGSSPCPPGGTDRATTGASAGLSMASRAKPAEPFGASRPRCEARSIPSRRHRLGHSPARGPLPRSSRAHRAKPGNRPELPRPALGLDRTSGGHGRPHRRHPRRRRPAARPDARCRPERQLDAPSPHPPAQRLSLGSHDVLDPPQPRPSSEAVTRLARRWPKLVDASAVAVRVCV